LPLLFVVLILGAMYFLMIRPQQRRAREQQRMQSTLGPGDEVMTSSGMYGEVIEIDETEGTVLLEVAPEVTVKFARAAVVRTVTPAVREAEVEDDEPDEPDDVSDADEPVAASTLDDEPEIVEPVVVEDRKPGAKPVIERRGD
jgi:preprotein translocase subunit YajC